MAEVDEQTLLTALARKPHDETLWQVYADWLEARGDARAPAVRSATVRAALAALAKDYAQQLTAATFHDACEVVPRPVEVIAATTQGERLVIAFVFHRLFCRMVQSGSDTYRYAIWGGRAVVVREALTEVFVEELKEIGISEWEVEWAPPEKRFDADPLYDDARRAWRDRALATPP